LLSFCANIEKVYTSDARAESCESLNLFNFCDEKKATPGKANEANAALKILIFNIAEPKSIAHAQQVRGDKKNFEFLLKCLFLTFNVFNLWG